MLASHALIMLGLPEPQVQERVNEVRHNRYRLLHGFYHGAQANLLDNRGQPKVLMHAVNLAADAHACGLHLSELGLEQLGGDVQSIQRNGTDLPMDKPGLLQVGDKVLMSGTLSAIEACEARLLAGQ